MTTTAAVVGKDAEMRCNDIAIVIVQRDIGNSPAPTDAVPCIDLETEPEAMEALLVSQTLIASGTSGARLNTSSSAIMIRWEKREARPLRLFPRRLCFQL